MADQSCAKVLGKTDRLSMSIERRRSDVLLIAWIGRGSRCCRDVGKGASGRVTPEVETMGWSVPP